MLKNKKSKVQKSPTLMDIIINIPFFEMLKSDELVVVARHTNYFELETGETLFNEGDPGNSVCFVVEGALNVYKSASMPGKTVRIATISKNRSIGEMSVIDEYTRSATVKARQKSAIVSLTKNGFDALLDENPRIGSAILKKIAKMVSMNLRRTSSQLADHMLTIT